MELVCHRCGNSLGEGEGFCPHCGAPQLVVDTSEPLGVQPPPQRLAGDMPRVQWRTGIASALLIAVPVGLLSVLGTGMSTLLVIAGGFATIALYRRRTDASTDGRIGWRLGSVLGAASAFFATAAWAVQLVVERYLLHRGAEIDKLFAAAAQQQVDYWMKASAQQGQQPPEVMHFVHNVASFLLSPDGHAASQLSTAIVMSITMVLFAAVGGAIAGRLLAARPRPQRTL
jgi:hypothetical protein